MQRDLYVFDLLRRRYLPVPTDFYHYGKNTVRIHKILLLLYALGEINNLFRFIHKRNHSSCYISYLILFRGNLVVKYLVLKFPELNKIKDTKRIFERHQLQQRLNEDQFHP